MSAANELNISHGSAFLLEGWTRAEQKYYDQFMSSEEFSGLFKWARAYEAVTRITGISPRCSEEDDEQIQRKFNVQNNENYTTI